MTLLTNLPLAPFKVDSDNLIQPSEPIAIPSAGLTAPVKVKDVPVATPMLGVVRVLLERISVPASVARVPAADGKVMVTLLVAWVSESALAPVIVFVNPNVLLVKVSVPASVANVPELGSVRPFIVELDRGLVGESFCPGQRG